MTEQAHFFRQTRPMQKASVTNTPNQSAVVSHSRARRVLDALSIFLPIRHYFSTALAFSLAINLLYLAAPL